MKKYIILLFLFTFFFCNSENSIKYKLYFNNSSYDIVSSKKKLFENLSDQYGKLTVIKSIYFLNILDPNDSIFLTKSISNWLSIDSLILVLYNNDVDNFAKLNNIDNKSVIEMKIKNWCFVYNICSNFFLNEEEVYFEEIIFNVNKTKHLFKNFLNIEEQDWGSLSSEQSYELFYDVVNYISQLDHKEQMLLLSNIFTTYNKYLLENDN